VSDIVRLYERAADWVDRLWEWMRTCRMHVDMHFIIPCGMRLL
jgi:hypothetical protein